MSVDWIEFSIIDTEFTDKITLKRTASSTSITSLIAIILIYRQRNLPIVPNIVLFYKLDDARMAFSDKEIIDRYRPDLEYGTKYFPCVLRQLVQLKLIK